MTNYIEEILTQFIEDAEEIKISAVDEFEKGKLLGYYECISKILNQADAFEVFDKLPKRIQDFNPESLLDLI